MIQKRRIGIIGTGHVGVAAAYALFLRGLASEIVLIDRDAERAEGEAMDLTHGRAFGESVDVSSGSYEDLADAQVVVVTAGVAQQPGESRLNLLNRNAEVFRDIVAQLDRHAPQAALVIASNPVDILTHITQRLSRRDPRCVIGTGTLLDTARFRTLLGRHYGVDARSVHAYIVGEHGDSEVPLWSSASIGGVRLVDHTVMEIPFDENRMRQLFEAVRDAAYAIIVRKGYTNTAIGVAIVRLVAAILDDQRSVLPVSRRLNGEYGLTDICLSIPSVIGRQGVEGAILPPLDATELEGLERSAAVIGHELGGIAL
ncbi:MAG: L-lactate dehydrogenase [Desulfosarcinaceae bacterium]|jgi:L-lactate dehydrogenase